MRADLLFYDHYPRRARAIDSLLIVHITNEASLQCFSMWLRQALERLFTLELASIRNTVLSARIILKVPTIRPFAAAVCASLGLETTFFEIKYSQHSNRPAGRQK